MPLAVRDASVATLPHNTAAALYRSVESTHETITLERRLKEAEP